MKNTKTIAFSALLLVSLGSMEAKTRFSGVRRMFKDSVHSTRDLAGTQIKTVAGAIARALDQVLYPAAFLVIGNHVVANWPEGLAATYPKTVQETISSIPYGQQANDALVRVVAGCVAVAAAHAVLTTDTMGGFIDTNMPHLSRLLSHVSTENGLKSKRFKEKSAAL